MSRSVKKSPKSRDATLIERNESGGILIVYIADCIFAPFDVFGYPTTAFLTMRKKMLSGNKRRAVRMSLEFTG